MGNFGLIYFDALPKVVIITVVASLLMASSIHQSWKLNIFGFRCRYFSSIDSRSGSGPHLPWTDRWRGSGARFERFRFSAGDREIPRADSIETISSSCSTQPPRLTGHHIHWLRACSASHPTGGSDHQHLWPCMSMYVCKAGSKTSIDRPP